MKFLRPHFFLPILAWGGLIDFHVPIDSSAPIALSIDATLAVNGNQVSVVRGIFGCDDQLGVLASFVSHSPPLGDYPALSYFTLTPRPGWAGGATPCYVCVDGAQVGQLVFYEPPSVTPHVAHHTAIPLRVFVNQGWRAEFPPIPCIGCDTQVNSMALKEGVAGLAPCAGRREEHNVLFRFLDDSGKPMNPFPFRISVDHNQLHATTFANRKFMGSAQVALTKLQLHVCFYPDRNADRGVLVGTAAFGMSASDTEGLVFFLLFVGVGFPLICISALLLQCHRLKKHRKMVSSVKHYVQRVQLEQEMLLRHPVP